MENPYPSKPTETRHTICKKCVEQWMETWDDDCSSYGPSLEQVIELLNMAGVEVI